ncbi:DJ-1/PfpI family protein [Desulforhopalus vacuolatus]|uniref:DJ-1 family glyoxalase III n=1 Tax=Desulforhopalus vacuolatus TaxID=40414 RepID=UPI001962598C|nr:DJ-1 family glyoxalase III [Desulforhopalus vacuolatus]MBM9519990.1 DJ-1/PfpI family protein [Desulforhopalus vacuolatus]
MSKVLVALAEGFETVEALAVVDVMRRGGVEVVTASIGENQQVNSSHKVQVTADKMIHECMDSQWDLIVIPGGVKGSENLAKSPEVEKLLKNQNAQGRLFGGICAAPAVVLEKQGLLEGKKAACHPAFMDKIAPERRQDEGVVVAGNCVTGRGAGWSIPFALEMLEKLEGKEKREAVEQGMALR